MAPRYSLVFGNSFPYEEQVSRIENLIDLYFSVPTSGPLRRERFDEDIKRYISEFGYSGFKISPDLQLKITKYDSCLCLHLDELTYEAARAAVVQNPYMLEKIPDHYVTDEVIKSCPPQFILRGVRRQTKEIKQFVLSQIPDCICDVRNPTKEDLLLCYEYVSEYSAAYCRRIAKRFNMKDIMVYLTMKFSLT